MSSTSFDSDVLIAIVLAVAGIAAGAYAFRYFGAHPFRGVLAGIAALLALLLGWVFAFFQISLM